MRYKFIEISPELMLQAILLPQDRSYRVEFASDPIPQDAKPLRCAINEYGNLILVIESAEFDDLLEGEKIPQMTPHYRQVDNDPEFTELLQHADALKEQGSPLAKQIRELVVSVLPDP